MESKKNGGKVLDGSDLMELVGNKQVFSSFVHHKFELLDKDKDGKLSVKELQPAVADIGAALGLPLQATSSDSDHIYSQVLNEFARGKQGAVNQTEFKEVLSDILLGMAAGLKRDPIVILRIDGEDLFEFINSPSYEPDMISIFSQLNLTNGSIRDYITKALELLNVDQGMPPSSDSWVMNNIVEPALQSRGKHDREGPVTQERFLEEFKNVAETMVKLLKDQPIIVAHSEQTFDGAGIRRLLSNKFEFNKTMDTAMKDLSRDCNGKVITKEFLRVVLDLIGSSAGLPPYGTIDEMDKLLNEGIKKFEGDDGKVIPDEEFKKLMTEILGRIMLQLEGKPIAVSSNSVVHEPLSSSSDLLDPSIS